MRHEDCDASLVIFFQAAFAHLRLAATLSLGFVLATMLATPVALAATTVEVSNFGSNPGNLKMFKHIPDGMPTHAALVVVMHGCTQDARTFTRESGWIGTSDKFR